MVRKGTCKTLGQRLKKSGRAKWESQGIASNHQEQHVQRPWGKAVLGMFWD